MADPCGYGTVTGLFSLRVTDSDDTDQNPDRVLIDGSVTFTPQTGLNKLFVRYPVAGETVRLSPIDALINEGVLCDQYGKENVTLVSSIDDRANPPAWNWRVDFNMRDQDGNTVPYGPVEFQLPRNGVVNLARDVIVKSTSTGLVVQGPAGPAGDGSGGGGVSAVNGKTPDDQGVITLLPEDLSAQPYGDYATRDDLEGKADNNVVLTDATAEGPVRSIDITYDIVNTAPELERLKVRGFSASWRNEWGALRGTSPYVGFADALVRALRTDQDSIGSGANGEYQPALELEDRRAGRKADVMWGRSWRGDLIRNDVAMSDLVIVQAGAPIPSALPPKTAVMVQRSTGVVRWSGGVLPDVTAADGNSVVVVDDGGAHGETLSVTAPNGGSASAWWAVPSANGFCFRAYVKTPTQWPNSAAPLLGFTNGFFGPTVQLLMAGTGNPGQVRLSDNSFDSGNRSGNNILALNNWYRFELRFDAVNGWGRAAVWDDGVPTPLWDSGQSAGAYGATSSYCNVGGMGGSNPILPAQTLYDDVWVAADSSDWIGPAGGETPDEPPTLHVWTGTTLVPPVE